MKHEGTPCFTVVFEGDLRAIKSNPHMIVSEFGEPRTISTGDLVNCPKRDAADDMYEALLLASLSSGFQYMTFETRGLISAALAKARGEGGADG